jgi:hypothetical protein
VGWNLDCDQPELQTLFLTVSTSKDYRQRLSVVFDFVVCCICMIIKEEENSKYRAEAEEGKFSN